MGSINDLQLSGRTRTGRRSRSRRRRAAIPDDHAVDDELRGHLAVAYERASALLADLDRGGA